MKWEKKGARKRKRPIETRRERKSTLSTIIDLAYWDLQEILRRVLRRYNTLVTFFVCNFTKLKKRNSVCVESNASIFHAVGRRQSGEAMRFRMKPHTLEDPLTSSNMNRNETSSKHFGLREGLSSEMQKYLRVVAKRRLFSCASSCIAPFFPIHPPF